MITKTTAVLQLERDAGVLFILSLTSTGTRAPLLHSSFTSTVSNKDQQVTALARITVLQWNTLVSFWNRFLYLIRFKVATFLARKRIRHLEFLCKRLHFYSQYATFNFAKTYARYYSHSSVIMCTYASIIIKIGSWTHYLSPNWELRKEGCTSLHKTRKKTREGWDRGFFTSLTNVVIALHHNQYLFLYRTNFVHPSIHPCHL